MALAWGSFTSLLFWLSQILDSHKVPALTLVCEVIGVLASARFFWILFINQSGKHPVATPLSVAYILLGCGVCGWLFWQSFSQPVPRFKLVLKSTAEFQNINLELTNDFLFFDEGQVVSTLDMIGYLVIPVTPGQSNISLYFSLEPNSDAIDNRLAEVVISIPKYLECAPTQGWSETDFPAANGQFTKSLGAKLDLTQLLPNDWIKLPVITFSTPSYLGEYPVLNPIHVRVRAKSMPTMFCGFWMVFPTFSTKEKPQMNRGQRISDPDKPGKFPFIRANWDTIKEHVPRTGDW